LFFLMPGSIIRRMLNNQKCLSVLDEQSDPVGILVTVLLCITACLVATLAVAQSRMNKGPECGIGLMADIVNGVGGLDACARAVSSQAG
jgi:hypothetical protein